jgi:hypothetical protein
MPASTIIKNTNLRVDNPELPMNPVYSPLIPLANNRMTCIFRGGDPSIIDMRGLQTITKVGSPSFTPNQWGVVVDGANYLQTSLEETDDFTVISIARQVQDATLNEEAFIFGNQVSSATVVPPTTGGAQGIKIAIQGVTGTNLLRTNITIASRRNSDAAYFTTNATVDVEDNPDSPRYRTNAVCFNATTRNLRAYEFEGYDPLTELTPTTNTTYNDRTFVGTTDQTRLKGGAFRIGASPIQTTLTPNVQVLAIMAFDIQLTAAQVKDQVVLLRNQFRRTETIEGSPTTVGATVATGYTPIDLFVTV